MEINKIKKEHKNEWLLIRVIKTDKRNRPTEGELVKHSKSRNEIYSEMKKVKGHTYTVYSGPLPKKGYAVAFYG